jgi:demethylmenaquinone methyltransferase/2-methoxy-6-polyprenyl-1,4-benzoquinol methylase
MEKKDRDESEPLAPHPPIRRFYASEAERRDFVGSLFDEAASQYEWINRVMSVGSGQRYRRDALRRAGVGPGMTVLDVCMGSGQVARTAVELVGADGRVVGLDASSRMLIEARKYVDIPMLLGVVEALPVADEFADFVTMGYALRHITDLRETFREFLRVLKPGGTLLMIEFSRPRSRIVHAVARLYLGTVVPAIASMKGRRAADMMRYFWNTIDSCVPPETILRTLREAGLEDPRRGGQIDLFAEYTAKRPTRAGEKPEGRHL